MWRLISAAERARTSSRSSDALTSSPISASVASTSAEVSAAAFSASVPVCDSRGFIEGLIIAGDADQQDARLVCAQKILELRICRIFSGYSRTLVVQLDFALVPKESTATSGIFRYRSA